MKYYMTMKTKYSATYNGIDEASKCNVEWKKPDINEYLLHESIDVMFKMCKTKAQ